jgi:hypothetical protein
VDRHGEPVGFFLEKWREFDASITASYKESQSVAGDPLSPLSAPADEGRGEEGGDQVSEMQACLDSPESTGLIVEPDVWRQSDTRVLAAIGRRSVHSLHKDGHETELSAIVIPINII